MSLVVGGGDSRRLAIFAAASSRVKKLQMPVMLLSNRAIRATHYSPNHECLSRLLELSSIVLSGYDDGRTV